MKKHIEIGVITGYDFSDKFDCSDWIDWVYKIGLYLDVHSWSFGVDNRYRIESAIDEFISIKSAVNKGSK